MKYPENVKKDFDHPFIYYQVCLWKNSKKQADESRYYKYHNQAVARARALYNSGTYEYINIREEIVYFRDDDHEYSTSSVIYHFGEA